jgi:hypothetical protein
MKIASHPLFIINYKMNEEKINNWQIKNLERLPEHLHLEFKHLIELMAVDFFTF